MMKNVRARARIGAYISRATARNDASCLFLKFSGTSRDKSRDKRISAASWFFTVKFTQTRFFVPSGWERSKISAPVETSRAFRLAAVTALAIFFSNYG